MSLRPDFLLFDPAPATPELWLDLLLVRLLALILIGGRLLGRRRRFSRRRLLGRLLLTTGFLSLLAPLLADAFDERRPFQAAALLWNPKLSFGEWR